MQITVYAISFLAFNFFKSPPSTPQVIQYPRSRICGVFLRLQVLSLRFSFKALSCKSLWLDQNFLIFSFMIFLHWNWVISLISILQWSIYRPGLLEKILARYIPFCLKKSMYLWLTCPLFPPIYLVRFISLLLWIYLNLWFWILTLNFLTTYIIFISFNIKEDNVDSLLIFFCVFVISSKGTNYFVAVWMMLDV